MKIFPREMEAAFAEERHQYMKCA